MDSSTGVGTQEVFKDQRLRKDNSYIMTPRTNSNRNVTRVYRHGFPKRLARSLAAPCAVLFVLGLTAALWADESIKLQPGRKQLVLDNHAIQTMTGLRRTMHEPEKKGAVFQPKGTTDGIRVQTSSAPVWVPGEDVYKLFYMAFPYRNSDWVVNEIGCAQAVSKDGLHWHRPALNLVDIRASRKNNRFFVVDPMTRWTSNSMMDVIFDMHEPEPNRRYKGLLGAQNRVPVVSADGIRWNKLGAKIQSSDTSKLIYDEVGERYIATVKHGTKYGRSAFVTFSRDFEHWTAPRLSFHTDDRDQVLAKERIRQRLADSGMQDPLFNDPDPDTGWEPPKGQRHIPTWRAEAYQLSLFPYEGVYIGLPMIYHPTGQALPARNNTVGFQDIQLMFSRDPELRQQNWVRLGDRKPFIETSRLDKGLVGNYDRLQIAPPNRPLVMGNELWFYYTGAKGRTPPYSLTEECAISRI
ncbi:MAG: hypothetical protein GY903_00390 [Fuerstiella sp.]|nr:hypothetical protein [Fuerstiella sp.]